MAISNIGNRQSDTQSKIPFSLACKSNQLINLNSITQLIIIIMTSSSSISTKLSYIDSIIGSSTSSEALPGALPVGQNSPQVHTASS